MLKNILNLDGAQQLSKNEQKEINGGRKLYTGTCENLPGGWQMICPTGTTCVDTINGPECLATLSPLD
jgi:hypothetical protein